MKKKVVVIGGGNGTAVVLEALKKSCLETCSISAVVSMTDSAGSSGRLREELGALPPGDILRAILALSSYDSQLLRDIFYRHRFGTDCGRLAGHNLGNIFLALAGQYSGDWPAAIRALAESVRAVGTVYPSTVDPAHLCVELTDGSMVKTEAAIDRPAYDRSLKIQRAWLEPEVPAYPPALGALEQAGVIILSPGSIYSSLIATLLPRGVREAIAASRAKLIYISPRGQALNGETGPETLSASVAVLECYLPRPLDMILYDNRQLTPTELAAYAARQWGALANDVERLTTKEVVTGDFESDAGGYSAAKLVSILKMFF